MISNHSKGIFTISLTALLWGILPIVLKCALIFFSIETIIWFRFTFSFAVLVGFYAVTNPRSFEILKRPPVIGVLAGLALAGNYYGFTRGLELTTPGNAQVLIQTSSLILAMIGVFYFKESLNWKQFLGFGIALIGFFLFYRDQINHLMYSRQQYFQGNIWILISAVTWAFFASVQKQLVRQWTPQQTNLLIYGAAALVFFPFVDFHVFFGLDLLRWSVLFFLGANTLIAYGALAIALKLIPANQVSAIIILNPLITLAASAVLFFKKIPWLTSENITAIGYLGAMVLLTGVGLVVGKPQKH